MSFVKLKTKCGAPLYFKHCAGEPGVVVAAHLKVGSVDDPPGKSGLLHFLEHLSLKETKLFPSVKDLAAYIEDVGGELDAGTDQAGLDFCVAVPKRSFKKAVRVLYEMIYRPVFSMRTIKTERNNILKEIRKYKDSPSERVLDLFLETVFSSDHPLGRPIVGTERSVCSITVQDIKFFYEKFFHPRNISFVVAGGITASRAKKNINEIFKEKSDNKIGSCVRKITIPRSFLGKTRIVEKMGIENAYIMIGAPFSGAHKRNSAVAEVFSIMLDGTSKLKSTNGKGWSFPMTETFDMQGLAYSFGVKSVFYRTVGVFIIYLEVDPAQIEEVCRLAKKLIEEKKSDKGLLEKAKKSATRHCNLLASSIKDDVDAACDEIATFGRPIPLEKTNARIKSVTIGEIRRFVDNFLNPDKLVTVVLKPN